MTSDKIYFPPSWRLCAGSVYRHNKLVRWVHDEQVKRSAFSSRRPGHLTPAQKVKMQMANGLPSVVIGIDDDAITGIRQSLVSGDVGRKAQQLAELPGIVRIVE